MTAPTRDEMEAALAKIDFCVQLQEFEPYLTIVVPFLEERKAHHLTQGMNVNLPAEKRAEHHEAYHLVESLLNLVENTLKENHDIAKRYHEAHPGEF